eukprot:2931965-Amphidinium_carterae.1
MEMHTPLSYMVPNLHTHYGDMGGNCSNPSEPNAATNVEERTTSTDPTKEACLGKNWHNREENPAYQYSSKTVPRMEKRKSRNDHLDRKCLYFQHVFLLVCGRKKASQ